MLLLTIIICIVALVLFGICVAVVTWIALATEHDR
jgi:hypothetical protein